MSRLRAAIAVAFCLAAGGCGKPATLQGDAEKIDVGLRVRTLVERELMLVDERLQMQALDGTLAGGDAASQLSGEAQRLLDAPVSEATLDGIVQEQQGAAQTFFAFVDAAVAHSSDGPFQSLGAGRMREIRADYATAITKGFDPGPELTSAYAVLARARGAPSTGIVSPFDNAEADAEPLLPTSPALPPPAAPRPVTPIPSG